jgi:hypothetical protein
LPTLSRNFLQPPAQLYLARNRLFPIVTPTAREAAKGAKQAPFFLSVRIARVCATI